MAARLSSFLLAALLLAACFNAPVPEAEPSPAVSEAEPSLDTALWEGRWEFNYTLVRLVGTTQEETSFEPGNKIRRIWEVRPGCDDRPCNSEITATNPDEPEAEAVVSVVDYADGTYRIVQNFPPEVSNSCRGEDGTVIPQAFEATNTVEVTPTDFEVRDGRAVVTEMAAVKRTAFTPKPEAAEAGGTCEPKSAHWEATVTPAGN